VKLGRVEKFRGHVTNDTRLRRCCATWLHDGGIGDDTCDSEVPQACNADFANQDVPLDRIEDGCVAQAENLSGAHRIDVTVHDTE
jgi:hypothetical protein